MKSNPTDTVRDLLLTWIASDEKKSYESIRKNCLYLDKAYCLDMGDEAVWNLFWPLVRTGVADYVGKDFYAVTEPVAIHRSGIFLYTGKPGFNSDRTIFTGIYRTDKEEHVDGLRLFSFDGYSVLKSIPSVDKVVDAFDKSSIDLSKADYYHWKGKKGLTKRFNDGAVRYFCIPDILYQREVPSRDINPDAFSISYNWSRSLNNELSGVYSRSEQQLTMQSFALPIMIERCLFLESMTKGLTPTKNGKEILFPGISMEIAKEVNRILCNTIRYE